MLSSKNYQPLTHAQYDVLFKITDQYFGVAQAGRFTNRYFFGIIDDKGDLALNLDYFFITKKDCLIELTKYSKGKFLKGVLDLNLQSIVPTQYAEIKVIDSLLIGEKENYLYDIYHKKGTCLFRNVDFYQQNADTLTLAKLGFLGLMSTEGNEILPLRYKNISDLTHPKLFQKWTVVNKQYFQEFYCDSLSLLGLNKLILHRNQFFTLINLDSSQNKNQKILTFKDKNKDWIVGKNPNSGRWYGFSTKDSMALHNKDSIVLEKGKIKYKTADGWQVDWKKNTTKFKPYYDEIVIKNAHIITVKSKDFWSILYPKFPQKLISYFKEVGPAVHDKLIGKMFLKWGVFHHDQWIIKPYYDSILYANSVFVAYKDLRKDLFDSEGKLTFSTENKITINKDFIELNKDGKITTLGIEGRPLTSEYFDSIEKIGEFYWCQKQNLYLLFNKRGQKVADSNQIDSVLSSENGHIVFTKNRRFGMFNTNGNMIISNRYDSLLPFSEGLAPFKLRGKWGFLDKKEMIKIQPFYDEVSAIQECISIFRIEKKYGLLDAEGKEIFKPKFDSIYLSKKGNYLVIKEGKKGLISKNGIKILNPVYNEIEEVNNHFIVTLPFGKQLLNDRGIKILDYEFEWIKMENGFFLFR